MTKMKFSYYCSFLVVTILIMAPSKFSKSRKMMKNDEIHCYTTPRFWAAAPVAGVRERGRGRETETDRDRQADRQTVNRKAV